MAYGASLSEWEEATQPDVEQTADSTESSVSAEEDDAVTADNTESNDEAITAEVATPTIGPPPITAEAAESTIGTSITVDNIVYQEIMWDGLIPADFRSDAIMEKYQDQLAEIEDGSPEANALYTKMQEEFNNAPVNEVLDETLVRLPGFIAPLEYSDDLITEFLLVPYFGACIHTPPPPANQTVLVQVAEGQGIKPEDSYNPIWVMGKLTTEETTTELAAAGYYIQEAIFEPYTNTQ